MKLGYWAFNTYLVFLAAFISGCLSPEQKEVSTFAMHIETNPDATGRNGPVSIGRSDPFTVNVENAPFITERHVERASVIDSLGGFQIMVQFNRSGTWLLDQYSMASREKRAAIVSHFGEPRWLAAPKLSRRMSEGVLVFTPDATREEADRIVRGLNNLVKKIEKGVR